MAFTAPDILLWIAVTAGIDWLCFARWVDSVPSVTERGRRSYRDYFFPRILFLVSGGVLVAFAAAGGPWSLAAAALGVPMLAASHLIQYYWFVTD